MSGDRRVQRQLRFRFSIESAIFDLSPQQKGGRSVARRRRRHEALSYETAHELTWWDTRCLVPILTLQEPQSRFAPRRAASPSVVLFILGE